MSNQFSQPLEIELKAVFQNHVSMIAQFSPSIDPANTTLCDTIQEDFYTLDYLCQTPVIYANQENYTKACQLLDRVRNFLRLVNSTPACPVYQYEALSDLWKRANAWCEQLHARYDATDDEIWDLIEPVVPDVLKRLRHNLYEAIWWKPVPQMDIEILQRTEHVIIEYSSLEYPGVPGLVTIRFSIDRSHLV
jgi:hypothetical protein